MLKFSKLLAVSSVGLTLLANVASAQTVSEPTAIVSVQTAASGAVFITPDPDGAGFFGTPCPTNTIFIPATDENLNAYTAVALTALASGANITVRGACAGTIIVPNQLSITTLPPAASE